MADPPCLLLSPLRLPQSSVTLLRNRNRHPNTRGSDSSNRSSRTLTVCLLLPDSQKHAFYFVVVFFSSRYNMSQLFISVPKAAAFFGQTFHSFSPPGRQAIWSQRRTPAARISKHISMFPMRLRQAGLTGQMVIVTSN